jgi:multiple sugar transport system substrate-binding protein
MKKIVFSILVIISMVLVACGPAAAPATEAPAAPAATEAPKAAEPTATTAPEPTKAPEAAKATEVIWYVRANDNEQKWENEVAIPQFEAKNPNIKINLVVVPWADFDTKMQTMIAAGTPPDVWSHWGPSGFQDYVKRGLVADLTPLIEKDKFDLSDFEKAVLDIYTVDGKIMGLPILTTGSYIFYNKDLFDAAGVKYPTTNWDDTSWTYDAFLEKCKALTKNTDDPAKAVFGCNLAPWPNDQYVWMFGQDLYPDDAYKTGFADKAFLNSDAAIKAFQARQDLVWKLHYMPDPAQVDAMGGGDIFVAGKVAMHMTGGWGFWNFGTGGVKLHEKFKWGAAAIPYGGPNRRDVVFTDPWMMSSKTAHPQEAWEFMKYLASPEVQTQWTDLTGAPPVRISLEEPWYKSFPTMTPDEVKEVFLGSLKYGRESPNHLLVKFDQLNQVVQSALDPIVNNEKQAADTLPDANTKLEDALKQIAAEYKK